MPHFFGQERFGNRLPAGQFRVGAGFAGRDRARDERPSCQTWPNADVNVIGFYIFSATGSNDQVVFFAFSRATRLKIRCQTKLTIFNYTRQRFLSIE
jgi:hypothetical protein